MLEHCSHPAHSGDSPEPEGTCPGIVTHALGAHPFLGEGLVHCRPDDQCKIGNSSRQACVARSVKGSQVPDSRGRVLRVDADRANQATVLLFEVNGGELFAFAGLLDRRKNPSGNWVKTCSILATTANPVTSAIHDRMPVILNPDSYDFWLDPGMRDVGAVSQLLRPYDARVMRCYPVGTRINHVANDDEECSAPVELRPNSGSRLRRGAVRL